MFFFESSDTKLTYTFGTLTRNSLQTLAKHLVSLLELNLIFSFSTLSCSPGLIPSTMLSISVYLWSLCSLTSSSSLTRFLTILRNLMYQMT